MNSSTLQRETQCCLLSCLNTCWWVVYPVVAGFIRTELCQSLNGKRITANSGILLICCRISSVWGCWSIQSLELRSQRVSASPTLWQPQLDYSPCLISQSNKSLSKVSVINLINVICIFFFYKFCSCKDAWLIKWFCFAICWNTKLMNHSMWLHSPLPNIRCMLFLKLTPTTLVRYCISYFPTCYDKISKKTT